MARANSIWMLTLRLLLAVGCLVSFSGSRAIASALRVAPPATALGGQFPSTPVNEEEETERAESAKEAISRTDRRSDRSDLRGRGFPAPPFGKPLAVHPISCPTPLDPFRNGLGSPYRC